MPAASFDTNPKYQKPK